MSNKLQAVTSKLRWIISATPDPNFLLNVYDFMVDLSGQIFFSIMENYEWNIIIQKYHVTLTHSEIDLFKE